MVALICYLAIGIILGICTLRICIKDNLPFTKTEGLVAIIIIAVVWPIVILAVAIKESL